MSNPTATNYRIGQYDTFRNKTKVDYLQRRLLTAKLDSQIQFFESLNKSELGEGSIDQEIGLFLD
jgi:CRISPR-associated protein Cas1